MCYTASLVLDHLWSLESLPDEFWTYVPDCHLETQVTQDKMFSSGCVSLWFLVWFPAVYQACAVLDTAEDKWWLCLPSSRNAFSNYRLSRRDIARCYLNFALLFLDKGSACYLFISSLQLHGYRRLLLLWVPVEVWGTAPCTHRCPVPIIYFVSICRVSTLGFWVNFFPIEDMFFDLLLSFIYWMK